MGEFQQDFAMPAAQPAVAAGPHHAALPDADSVLSRRGNAGSRIAPFPKTVDLGEQIVGSSHEFEVATPYASEHALAVLVSAPIRAGDPAPNGPLHVSAEQRAEAFTPIGAPERTTAPIRVRFSPTFSGLFQADLKILLKWDDGAIDHRVVRIHARARQLTEAPADAIHQPRNTTAYDGSEIPTADLTGVAAVPKLALENLANKTKTLAAGLAAQQENGRDTAEKNVGSYKYAPPPPSLFDVAAEIALGFAVGGIASRIGILVATELVSLVPRGLANNHVTALAGVIEDGLKNAARAPGVTSEFKSNAVSSNGQILFFAKLQRALSKLATQNGLFVDSQNERLQHLLRAEPELAIATMKSLRASIEAIKDPAELQQNAAEQQWVSMVARSANGTSSVDVNGDAHETTKLNRTNLIPTAGILTIRVAVPATRLSEPTTVDDATINGVSQSLAEHLRAADLARTAIPILIVATSSKGTSLVTRDEVGRVRMFSAAERERDEHQDAQRFVDKVLSKSLERWGVKYIETDSSQ